MRIVKKFIKILFRKLRISHRIEYNAGKKIENKYHEYKGVKKIFFLMTPSYGNLGDQAIEIATYNYIKDEFGDYALVRIHLEDTFREMRAIEKAVNPEDLIFLQGGGNFGNMYVLVEEARRFVVQHLPNNKIISMPSTITYTDDSSGKKELDRSIKRYSKHKNFYILCREGYSFKYAKTFFEENKIVFIPDMVLYLSTPEKEYKTRNGIMLCLRQDKESVLNDLRDALIKTVYDRYDDVLITDTQVERTISDKVKEAEVYSVINQFANKQVVVTDRFHGLILSVITNTPCVVLPSVDKKIVGAMEIFKELNFIRYIETMREEDVLNSINELLLVESKNYINFREEYFKTLRKEIGE